MADGGADQVARLDVIVGSPGSTETLDATTSALRANGVAAVENAKSIDANTASQERLKVVSEGARQGTALNTVATGQLTLTQEKMTAAGIAMNTVLAAVNGSAAAQAEIMQKLSSASSAQALAIAKLAGVSKDAATATGELATVQGVAADTGGALAAANASVATTSESAFTGVGRIRQGLVSLIATGTGTIPVFDRIAAGFLSMGIGSGPVLGVIAGAAAIALAWKFSEGEADALKKKQEELVKSLDAWYDSLNEGGASKFVQEIDAMNAHLVELKRTSDSLASGNPLAGFAEFYKLALHDIFFNNTFDPAEAIQKFQSDWKKYVDGQKAAIAKGAEEIKAAARQAIEDGVKATQSFYGGEAGNLNALISAPANNAGTGIAPTAAEIKDAEDLLHTFQKALVELQSQYGTITDTKNKAFNLDRQSFLVGQIQGIDAALRANWLAPLADIQREQELLMRPPDAGVSGSSTQTQSQALVEHNNAVIASLLKQRDALGANISAENDLAIAVANGTRLAGLEGIAHDIVAAQIKEEAEQRAANARYANDPVELAHITALIQSEYDQQKATILATAATHDQEVALASMIARIKEGVDPTVAWRDAMKQLVDNLLGATSPAEKLSDTLKNDLLHGLDELATHGLSSYTAFANEIVRLTQQMAKSIGDGKKGFGDLKTELQGLQAGLVGGSLGYGIGSQTGSSAFGALGGAAGGAAAGEQILPGWGAVIGGLAGAAGGLLGAASAQSAAAKATQDAAVSLQNQVSAFANQGDPIVQANAQAAALRLSATNVWNSAASNGGDFDAWSKWLSDQFAQIAVALQKQLDNIHFNAVSDLGQQLNALNGPAGAYANQLDNINKKYAENMATVEALGLGEGGVAEVTDIYNKSLAALNQTIRDGIDATNEGYKLRAETAAGVDTFSQQQADELAKAIKDGEDPSSIALLKIAQGNELIAHNQAVAKQQAQDQITILQQQQQTLQQSLTAQQQAVTNLQGVIANLKSGSDSLKLGSLSGLSPIQQLAEAKSQLDALVATARGSDTAAAQAAANAVPAAITAFLTQSQNVNASGPGYVQDYNYAQSIYTTLGDQFSKQLDVQQAILNTLNDSNTKLTAQILLLQQGIDATNAASAQGQAQALLAQISNDPTNASAYVAKLHAMGYQVNESETNGMPTGQYSLSGFAGGNGGSQADIDAYNAILAFARQSQAASQYAATGSTTIPGYASGGDFGGGLHLVGERGPELESTGASHITSNTDIMAMLRDANSDVVDALKSIDARLVRIERQDAAGYTAIVEQTAATAANTRDTAKAVKQRDASASTQRSRNVGIAT